MSEAPNIHLGELISVSGNQAVISKIYPAKKNIVEFVYLQGGVKEMYDDAHGPAIIGVFYTTGQAAVTRITYGG